MCLTWISEIAIWIDVCCYCCILDLSAIESRAKRGSVDAFKRLAKALGVGLDDLA